MPDASKVLTYAPVCLVTGAGLHVDMALDAANTLYAFLRRGPARLDRGDVVGRVKDLVEDLERTAGQLRQLRAVELDLVEVQAPTSSTAPLPRGDQAGGQPPK